MFERRNSGDEEPGRDASQETSEFAELLAADQSPPPAGDPSPGERVTGTIVQIGETEAFVDCGGRSELPIALRELQDDQGVLTVGVGDKIQGWVKAEGERQFLTRAGQPRGRDTTLIEQAHQSGLPLEGTVRETNKGGFVVDLGGHRAFCPISQIDAHYVENPQQYVGQTFSFRVVEFGQGGRNIVVSRRALLREESDLKAAETRRTLQIGNVIEGSVSRLMTFGAFVDIGGMEGLVHVSEISHQHVESPLAVLRPGQEVKVKVIGIQNLGQGKQERISLSMKALDRDPWQDSIGELQIGSEVTGTVRRLMDYGAFIEILPGVQGLAHVSELADQRINHPREVLREGEEVTVRILDIDPGRKRVSLSVKQTKGAGEDSGED